MAVGHLRLGIDLKSDLLVADDFAAGIESSFLQEPVPGVVA